MGAFLLTSFSEVQNNLNPRKNRFFEVSFSSVAWKKHVCAGGSVFHHETNFDLEIRWKFTQTEINGLNSYCYYYLLAWHLS